MVVSSFYLNLSESKEKESVVFGQSCIGVVLGHAFPKRGVMQRQWPLVHNLCIIMEGVIAHFCALHITNSGPCLPQTSTSTSTQRAFPPEAARQTYKFNPILTYIVQRTIVHHGRSRQEAPCVRPVPRTQAAVSQAGWQPRLRPVRTGRRCLHFQPYWRERRQLPKWECERKRRHERGQSRISHPISVQQCNRRHGSGHEQRRLAYAW